MTVYFHIFVCTRFHFFMFTYLLVYFLCNHVLHTEETVNVCVFYECKNLSSVSFSSIGLL